MNNHYYCNMIYLSPFVVHNSYNLNETEIEGYARKYQEAIITLRDKKLSSEEIKAKPYFSDLF